MIYGTETWVMKAEEDMHQLEIMKKMTTKWRKTVETVSLNLVRVEQWKHIFMLDIFNLF